MQFCLYIYVFIPLCLLSYIYLDGYSDCNYEYLQLLYVALITIFLSDKQLIVIQH